ncbi:MAG: mannose-1-phosphate guanylyltransferase [Bacteroidales bacterium]
MNNNYCVIMSGGIGSRFWPISRSSKPKQFLDFFGTGHSLLQMTFNRFNEIIPAENIFIVTNESYFDLVKQQLPLLKDEQILLEPQRRNTAPCIAWASYHIRKLNPNANIVVSPSDHLIIKEEEFRQTISKALSFAAERPVLLTLGITPNRPETGYGYIQTDNEQVDGFVRVKTFTEKPNPELAKVFVESGEFLWNSGIFIWNVNSILDAFNTHLPEIASRFEGAHEIMNTPHEREFIQTNFPACPNISIDFGIMEKASNVFVLAANFGWSDLGTWGALYELSEKDEHDNVNLKSNTLAYESKNNIISLSSEHLVVIQGLEDYIIAEDNNVLLICKKEEEQRIRQFVTDAKVNFGDKYI